jgi:hypothetical protein
MASTPVVQEVALLKKHDTSDMSASLVALASDPNFNPVTLQALIDMHRAAQQQSAEQQFNAAMSRAQSKMRRIAADSNNPQTRSKYASYAAIDREIRPIYTEEGFSMTFTTEPSSLDAHVTIVCFLSHAEGFTRTYRIDMPNDGKGAKGGDVMTKTHATGSATTYGRRYLVGMIWNLAIGEDTDGNMPPSRDDAPEPMGYAGFRAEMESAAMASNAELNAVWKAAKPQFKLHATKHASEWLSECRNTAKTADGAK